MNAAHACEAGRPQYWMPSHVRACVTPTGAILLDLQRNRYFALGGPETQALATLALNWSELTTCACEPAAPMLPWEALTFADSLSAAGFLSQAPAGNTLNRQRAIDGPRPIEPLLQLDMTSSLSLRREAGEGAQKGQSRRAPVIRIRDISRFTAACVWARYAVSSRRLYSIACEVNSRRAVATSPKDVHRAVELVRLFRCMRPYAFAAKDQCLFHALALLRFLSCYGTVPTWVIGVRARPWAAHSWLQLGSLVLDCDPEELDGFTPILIV